MSDRYAKYQSLELDYPMDRVLRITLNKPETYNSLDKDGHREMAYIWRDIDEDPDISAVLLCAKGRAFSSGGDFGMIQENMDSHEALTNAWKEARDLVYNIINCAVTVNFTFTLQFVAKFHSLPGETPASF